jgi:hypothetical protein
MVMSMLLGWILFLPPWLLLAFLEPVRMRRFMSVAFFVVVLTTICYQMAAKLDWWKVTEDAFYFSDVSSFAFGLLPVAALSVFYLTYPNPWLYFGINLSIDLVQCFLIAPYVLEKAGLFEMRTMSYLGLYLIQVLVATCIYFYQKWYEHGLHYDSEAPLERWLRKWTFLQKAR